MAHKLINYIGTRVDPGVRSAFIKRAKKYSTPSDVLRELITGFAEDRVSINPPKPKEIFNAPRI